MCQQWFSICFVAGRQKGSRHGGFSQHLWISRDHCLFWGTKPFETIPYENVKLNTCFFFLHKAVILGVMFIIVWNSILRKQDEDKLKVSTLWKLALLDRALKNILSKCRSLLYLSSPHCLVLQILLKICQCFYKLSSSGGEYKILLKTAAIDCWTSSVRSYLYLKFLYSSVYSRNRGLSGFWRLNILFTCLHRRAVTFSFIKKSAGRKTFQS